MLRSLTIENVALIDRAELEFHAGLNVLSGETGAGKSVILDSIDFVLGAKADKTMVRYGKAECLVRAVFSVESETVREALRELDLDLEGEEELIISRRLTADGRSSLKLNGCTVTVSMLRRVTGALVDIHGQSEHFFLLREANQLRLLDSIAGKEVAERKAALALLLSERKGIHAELALLGGDEGERSRRMDILRFQIDEIDRAELKEGEEEELTELRARYRNAEKILTALSNARDFLLADGGGYDALSGAQRSLNAVSKFSDKYGELSSRLAAVGEEVSDVAALAEDYAAELDIDEAEAERAEERLEVIKSLKKKYGGSVAAVLAFCEEARSEYEKLAAGSERCEELRAQLKDCEDRIYAACLSLTAARKEAAKGFTERVTKELSTLNVSSAVFEVQFDGYTREDAGRANGEGLDGVRFLFSANKGEPVKELGKIISGGEMSRFMLAVKAQLSAVNGIGTYLFDEIDTGIGGKTARVVAEKFCKISRGTQIIAVSHLAGIAAFADRNFLIEKHEEGDRTYTTITQLEGSAILGEIARLVGGDPEGEFALRHAEELVKSAQTYKNSL